MLRARPERNIVVVSHGVFLETLMNRSALFCVDDALKLKRYENAELRSVRVAAWWWWGWGGGGGRSVG